MQERLNTDIIHSESRSDREFMQLIGIDSESNNTDRINKMKRAVIDVVRNELSYRQKQYIMLYYYRQMSIPEIARLYNVNKSTVSRTLSRAKRNILIRLEYI